MSNSDSMSDKIEINYPKYNLPKNFLESVREVFGNIKIDLDLNLDFILKHNLTNLDYKSKDDELYILMTYPFYYKIIKKNEEIFIKYNHEEYKYLDNYYCIDNFKKISNYIDLKAKAEEKAKAKAKAEEKAKAKAKAEAKAKAKREYDEAEREYERAKKNYERVKNAKCQEIKNDTNKDNSYILFSNLNKFILINKYRILILKKDYKDVITKKYEINKDNITTELINDNLNNFNNVFAFLDYKFLRKYLIYISYDKKKYIEDSSSIAEGQKGGRLEFFDQIKHFDKSSNSDNNDNFIYSKYKYIMLTMCAILYSYNDQNKEQDEKELDYNKVILNILNNIKPENIKLFKNIEDDFFNKNTYLKVNIDNMNFKDRYNILKELIKKDFYFNLLYEFIKKNFILTTGKINDITYDDDWRQYFKIIKNNMYSEIINNKKITKLYEDYKTFLNKKIFSDDDDILINFEYLLNIDSIISRSLATSAPAVPATDPATDPVTDPAAVPATDPVAAPAVPDIINNDKLSSSNLVTLFILSYDKKNKK